MKHKIFALLMCLALLVTGLSATAAEDMETVTTITMEAGPLMAEYEDVGQILDIAGLRIHSMPGGYGAFTLTLNDADALQSLFKLEQEGVYVQSGIFGQQPIYFAWEDLKALLMEQMEAYAEMQPDDMPFDMDMMQAVMEGSLTDEQMYEMMGIDEELLALISDIESRKVAEKGTFAIGGSDEADLKTETVLTGDDIVRVLDLPMVREQIAMQIQMSDAEASQEDVAAMVEEQMADMKQDILNSNIVMTVTVYTQGDELIAFIFTMTGDMDDYTGGTVPISIGATLTRTTIDTAKFYQYSVVLSEGGEDFLNQNGSLYLSDTFATGQYTLYMSPDEPLFHASLNCDRSQAGQTSGELSLTLYDTYTADAQSVYLMFEQLKAENATDTAIDVYAGGSVDAVKAALNETGLISIDINTVQQPDSGFFASLQDASPDASVQLLQMTDEELQVYMQTMQQGLMMTVLNIIDNLPPEMSEALMQSMNGGF